ncbi:hypothetical protein [Antrihabitans sp. YC2-6]|uniref:hypothetical protein n=1 Tax=Antrihabitans sp. YC2-6 TaxID=2799498 RepID=UPI0018F64969|nr:hypothetical protein [Antrihabitans sp. YC2-6]MBJ8346927.1 hypothetical protein [Antrihabitans sp. YC2-6]
MTDSTTTQTRVLIIGTGFSSMGTAIQLPPTTRPVFPPVGSAGVAADVGIPVSLFRASVSSSVK